MDETSYGKDPEIDPTLREEQERREQDEEFARRVRREVRRINRGEADREMEEEERAEEAEREAEEENRRRRERRSSRLVALLFTGGILTKEEVKRLYPYLMCVGAMFFLSIFVLFSALRLDIRRTRMEKELQQLREKSVRQSERIYSLTSRQVIMEQLEARGLELEELPTQTFIIDGD